MVRPLLAMSGRTQHDRYRSAAVEPGCDGFVHRVEITASCGYLNDLTIEAFETRFERIQPVIEFRGLLVVRIRTLADEYAQNRFFITSQVLAEGLQSRNQVGRTTGEITSHIVAYMYFTHFTNLSKVFIYNQLYDVKLEIQLHIRQLHI